MTRSSVLLPLPLGPTMAATWPVGMVSVVGATASMRRSVDAGRSA